MKSCIKDQKKGVWVQSPNSMICVSRPRNHSTWEWYQALPVPWRTSLSWKSWWFEPLSWVCARPLRDHPSSALSKSQSWGHQLGGWIATCFGLRHPFPKLKSLAQFSLVIVKWSVTSVYCWKDLFFFPHFLDFMTRDFVSQWVSWLTIKRTDLLSPLLEA